nr:MAG: hypothetical protein [Ips virga-like virus 1]
MSRNRLFYILLFINCMTLLFVVLFYITYNYNRVVLLDSDCILFLNYVYCKRGILTSCNSLTVNCLVSFAYVLTALISALVSPIVILSFFLYFFRFVHNALRTTNNNGTHICVGSGV